MRRLSGVAASASSCGRQPADTGSTNAPSREAATGIQCRRFTALGFLLPTFRGLTPTAICWYRFAIQPDRHFAIHACECLANIGGNHE